MAATTAVSALIDIATLRDYRNERREYIGASGIGDPCDAYQALCLRGFESEVPSPKLIRIFRDGHRIESLVIDDMRKAGIEISEIDPATGKQWRFTAFGGLMSASLDGIVTMPGGEVCTLEIKSMNRALFAKFKTHGLEKSHPHYVHQISTGIGLARHYGGGKVFAAGVLVAYCKDTSEYHAERVEYRPHDYAATIARVYAVITGQRASRISTHSESFACKSCFKRTACWEPASMENLGCKQCQHAYPDEDTGQWDCAISPGAFGVKCKSFRVYRIKNYGQKTTA